MKKLILLIVIALFAFSACDSGIDENPAAEKFKILTSIPVLYSLTANIADGAQNVEIQNIVPPNASFHTFSLTPEAAKNIAEADLIVLNGLGLEEFLGKSLEGSKALIVDTGKNVELLEFSEPLFEDAEAEEEEHVGKYDPHIWLSPKNAKIQVQNIADALIVADSKNALIYAANLKILSAQLDLLDSEISSELSELDIKPYLVFHDAYQYFEKNFGVQSVGFLEENVGNEPSAKYLAQLVEVIEKEKVEVIFAEPQFSPKLAQTLSQDYGLKIETLNPDGGEVSKDGYFKLMRGNLDAFEKIFNVK
ncbi:zinc ABC transporter substrate-binding protein [Candidatus Peregrinibacteria bacterium]|nr:zinc ABC transporter substrate-binding protein [Candidatus Peregrinibacteria bacterium]